MKKWILARGWVREVECIEIAALGRAAYVVDPSGNVYEVSKVGKVLDSPAAVKRAQLAQELEDLERDITSNEEEHKSEAAQQRAVMREFRKAITRKRANADKLRAQLAELNKPEEEVP